VPGDTYLLYCDDSGDNADSFYSAVLIPVQRWTHHLETWLKFRQWLYRQHEVPSRYELHAYQWIPAKGPDPVPDKPTALINRSTGLRREVARKALQTLASMDGVAVVTSRHPGAVKSDAYAALLKAVDTELASRGDWALVITDGAPENPDPHVLRSHRDLALGSRRIVEDGWVQNAHASQFLQVADLVVHCAFQAHRRLPAREFMWGWYAQYVHQQEWGCACPP
jgi:hypothetical protein